MTKYNQNSHVEVDSAEALTWGELLREFDDANIYQTWSWGANNCSPNNLSSIILRNNGEVMAMALVRIRTLPVIRGGVASIFWGPVWQRRGRSSDPSVLEWMIDALKKEYVVKRGYLLRIWPRAFESEGEEIISILERNGFVFNPAAGKYQTLILDIEPSLENLRINLHQKWRNQLKSAEKSNLDLIEGTSDTLFLEFLRMLGETISRKNFKAQVDYDLYRRIQNELPDDLKMNIVICTCKGNPVSAGVFSAIGGTGTYLLGASANNGLGVNGSNYLHWGVIKWLKERGCHSYDLGGIDPIGNPGVYRFKRGLAGKNGRELTHIGQYYLADNSIGYYLNKFINRTYHAGKIKRRILKYVYR